MKIPGGVYLCQASKTLSCGACCGLYNVSGWSKNDLKEMLTRRTERFANVPRTADAILAFGREIEKEENNTPPLPEFHHCPYLGLVGETGSRVGCILHPLGKGNGGVDFRGLSYHGGLACHMYFCPTHREVSAARKEIIKTILTDWYEYGFVITEAAFISAIFDEIDRRIGTPATPEHISSHPEAQAALRELLTLKLSWPFRRDPSLSPVHYFFKDDVQLRPKIDYERIGMPVSEFDRILVELETAVDSDQGLKEAEDRLERLFREVAEALER